MSKLNFHFYQFQFVSFLSLTSHRMLQLLVPLALFNSGILNQSSVGWLLSLTVFSEVASTLLLGHLADSYNKIRLITFTYIGSFVWGGLFFFVVSFENSSLVGIGIAMTFLGCMLGIRQPIEGSIIPYLVKSNQIKRAISQKSMLYAISTIAGPAIAVFCIDLFPLNLVIMCYLFTIALALCVLSLITSYYREPQNSQSSKPKFGFKQLTMILKVRIEFYLALMSSGINFFLMPFFVLLIPMYISTSTQFQNSAIALIEGVFSVGILAGSMFINNFLTSRIRRSLVLTMGYLFLSVGPFILSWSTSLSIIMIGFFVSGLGFIITNINNSILRTTATPASHLNKIVSSVMFISKSINPLGVIVLGFLNSVFNAQVLFFVGSVYFILCGLLIYLIPHYKMLMDLESNQLNGKYAQLYPEVFS